MIPTFIIDEPFLVFLGLLASWFIPRAWGGSVFKTRAFLAGAWIVLGFMAGAAYGYVVAPDWMFMYLVPAAKVPFWIVVYIFIFYFLLYIAGFLLGHELRKIHGGLFACALLLFLAASVAVVLPLRKEYLTIATYEEFFRGGGIPLSESPIGKNTTLPAVGVVVTGIALLWWAKRQKAS